MSVIYYLRKIPRIPSYCGGAGQSAVRLARHSGAPDCVGGAAQWTTPSQL